LSQEKTLTCLGEAIPTQIFTASQAKNACQLQKTASPDPPNSTSQGVGSLPIQQKLIAVDPDSQRLRHRNNLALTGFVCHDGSLATLLPTCGGIVAPLRRHAAVQTRLIGGTASSLPPLGVVLFEPDALRPVTFFLDLFVIGR
jgi:hypothetical protein